MVDDLYTAVFVSAPLLDVIKERIEIVADRAGFQVVVCGVGNTEIIDGGFRSAVSGAVALEKLFEINELHDRRILIVLRLCLFAQLTGAHTEKRRLRTAVPFGNNGAFGTKVNADKPVFVDVGSRIPCDQRLFQRNKHLSVFRFRRFVRPEFPMAGVDILQALFIVDLQICTHFVACKKPGGVRIDEFRRQCEIACKSFGNFYFDLCPVQSEDGLKPVYLFL